MRDENQMMRLIVTTGVEDHRIRAAILSGSRANPNAIRDRFQDYDVLYAVRSVEPFVRNSRWIDRFGELLILQTPDLMGDTPQRDTGRFTYLMQFTDGTRIDLTLVEAERVYGMRHSSQSIVLLDKDGRLPPLPMPSDSDYRVKRPVKKQFDDCCNEFWWVSLYVLKGIARRELPYAQYMLNGPVRSMLQRMLSYGVGYSTDFSVSVGKYGKHLQKYLAAPVWERYQKTYAGGDCAEVTRALRQACALFAEISLEAGRELGYTVPEYGEKVYTYLLNELKNATAY